jgi:hypothetical protein
MDKNLEKDLEDIVNRFLFEVLNDITLHQIIYEVECLDKKYKHYYDIKFDKHVNGILYITTNDKPHNIQTRHVLFEKNKN